MQPMYDDVYIDAGAYEGFTIGDFLTFCDVKYRKIYALEPDVANFKRVKAIY